MPIDKTHYALEGLPASDLATELKSMEDLYAAAIGPFHWRQRLRIAREQVLVLALRLAEIDNRQVADRIQAEKYVEFIRLMGEPALLGRFLRAEFPTTFERMSQEELIEQIGNHAITRRMRLTEIAMHILGELKAGRKVN